jgi:hypothetical protein
MTDPTRLLDGDAELSLEERRALVADRDQPSPMGAKRAIWAALSLQLAAPATAAAMSTGAASAAAGTAGVPAGTGIAGTLTTLALVKSATVGVALGAVVGTGLYFEGRAETPRPAPVAVESAGSGNLGATAVPAPFQSAPRRSDGPPPAAASDSVPPSVSAPPAERTPARGELPQAPAARGALPAAPESESRRVARARSWLRSGNAAAALTVLESLARDEPNGLLVQEREALLVETLAALGRRADARARAGAFLARYPTSPHAAAVRRAAGLPAAAPNAP